MKLLMAKLVLVMLVLHALLNGSAGVEEMTIEETSSSPSSSSSVGSLINGGELFLTMGRKLKLKLKLVDLDGAMHPNRSLRAATKAAPPPPVVNKRSSMFYTAPPPPFF